MRLSIGNRLALLSVLPGEGDITTIRIVRQLKENLSFSEEEHKQFRLESKPGVGTTWQNASEDPMKDIAIGEKAREIIANNLRILDSRKQLTEGHIEIWSIFVDQQFDADAA